MPWTLSIPTRHPASVDGHQAAQDRRRITGGSQVLTTLTASINAGSYTEPLLPSQLGSKSKGGVKPIVRAVERALIGTMDQDYTHLVSLDAANAFNAMHLPSSPWHSANTAAPCTSAPSGRTRHLRTSSPASSYWNRDKARDRAICWAQFSSLWACDHSLRRSRPTSDRVVKWSLIPTTCTSCRRMNERYTTPRSFSRIGPTHSA